LLFFLKRDECKGRSPSHVPILYSNIRSLVNDTNLNHVQLLLDEQKFSIMAFTETWCKQKIPDGLILGENAKYHQMVRCDRKRKRGGETIDEAYEVLIFDANINANFVRIFVIYRVPSLSQKESEKLWKILNDFIICQHPSVMMGDFNIPTIQWPLDQNIKYKGIEESFIDFVEIANLIQTVEKPSRDKNFLDLIFTNDHDLITNVEVTPPIGNSDHRTIIYEMPIGLLQQPNKTRRNFSKGNYEIINSILAKINWKAVFRPIDSVNIMYEKLLSILDIMIDCYIPMSRVNLAGIPVPMHIEKKMKYGFLYWQKWISSKDPLYKHEYERAHKICIKSMEKYALCRKKALLANADRKGFYRYIKSKLHDSKGNKIDSLTDDQYVVRETDSEKADTLATTFSSVFTSDNGITPIFSHKRESEKGREYDAMFSRFEICDMIEKWKNSSCRTPDNINMFFIKSIAVPLAIPLEIIFEKSYETAEVPKRWKHSIITPLRKKPPFSDPLNYRPVSITSFFCRVFEKCLSKRIIDDCESFDHAKTICKIAETKANLVFKALHSRDEKILLNAYCTYIRPTLEFSSSVARPIHSTDRDRIEKVQNSVTRRIFYKAFKCSYNDRPNHTERNKALNLHSLEHRRRVNDAKLAYQMIFGNGKLALSRDKFFTFVKTRTRGAGHKIFVDMPKTKLRENIF
ncbi:hypothetical protein PMAYCL1PPCAC_31535, partial [Pristionchus mayeri]